MNDYLTLEGLDEDIAVDLVLSKSGESRETPNESGAHRLAELLGYHPLALIVAGSLIRKDAYSMNGFAEAFVAQTWQEDLLETRSVRSPYGEIDATFEISARFLHCDALRDPAAALGLALFDIFGLFNRAFLHEKIFTLAGEHEETVLRDPSDGKIDKISTWHVERSREVLYCSNVDERLLA